MSLLQLQNIYMSYGHPPLLEGVNFSLEKGERVCLIGRNGTGKSTLMKIITGEIKPDDGQVIYQSGVKVTRLEQEVPQATQGSIYEVVASGLGEITFLLQEYHQLSHQLTTHSDTALLDKLHELQTRLEEHNAWQIQQHVDTVITRLNLEADADFSALSGGMKRRVLLAKALVLNPDVLLLDEPTNHLDLESIQWLEEFFIQQNITLLFITHDRAFLRKLATRIIELDRGKLLDWPGNYAVYLERKTAALAEEERHNALFDKKLAQEEIWIRQGIKARRTRNEGRVRALKKLREERHARRERIGTVKLELQEAERSGQLVVEAQNISYQINDRPLIQNFSTLIMAGDKIGIIGKNGSGKTTLLRLLLGQLAPQLGQVKLGTHLQIAYFDQLRNQLNENETVQDNVGQGRDSITINGKSKHIISYLQDFLFSPERARSPIKNLSGGERNRLLLAKLFTQPANLLVLDEPTNDLDVETLELLEDLLVNYQGTLLLVSHDREFLNNVVTSTIVFESRGKLTEYAGGYDDYLLQCKPPKEAKIEPVKKDKPVEKNAETIKPRKLSYKEQQELAKLPQLIEQYEIEQQTLYDHMAQSSFYQQPAENINTTKARLAELEKLLAQAYQRWEELESLL